MKLGERREKRNKNKWDKQKTDWQEEKLKHIYNYIKHK